MRGRDEGCDLERIIHQPLWHSLPQNNCGESQGEKIQFEDRKMKYQWRAPGSFWRLWAYRQKRQGRASNRVAEIKVGTKDTSTEVICSNILVI